MAYRMISVITVVCAAVLSGQDLPDWVSEIREDHPRLFFNADTFPGVKARALGDERDWFDRVKGQVDRSLKRGRQDPPTDRGVDAAKAAFVFLVTEDPAYFDHARACLDEAVSFYELCLSERRPVNWYSTSRVHAVLAWDWLYQGLPVDERRAVMARLVDVIHGVLTVKPRIHRENYSGHTTGFYGVRNVLWFLGCTAYGTGIAPERVNEWLIWGRTENEKLLAHRKRACGDDGGGASPTLGYIFGAYPWSEQNYFYTWLSATGTNIAPDWPHSAWLAHYVVWNWISSPEGPREYGYGDTPHTSNALPTWQLYTHMANIRHLYSEQLPRAAGLAAFVQNALPERQQRHTDTWFIYPFLLTNEAKPVPDASSMRLPHARHFDHMGQVFMRSGLTSEDTYALFTCGGVLRQHRHFDALNLVLYHRGHQALDTGTRYRENENGEHLANYYAQTVAHNCVLIHQPNEPYARYWGGTVVQMHGGQHSQLGSVVKAFETNDDFVYVAGDATACYRHNGRTADGEGELPQKTDWVSRQVVFLMPDLFVVFDRVRCTDPSYRKQWLLHTAYEPEIDGALVRADHVNGRLFCRTMLPADAGLEAVGGEGKRFRASGRNWSINTKGLKEDQIAMMGQWRVEVSPGEPRANDLFLHVLQVGAQDLQRPYDMETLDENGAVGVRVSASTGTWDVLFRKDGDPGGRIRRTGGDGALDRALAEQVTAQEGITTVGDDGRGVLLREMLDPRSQ